MERHVRCELEKTDARVSDMAHNNSKRPYFFSAGSGFGARHATRPSQQHSRPQMYRVLRRAYRVATTADPYFGCVHRVSPSFQNLL